MTPMAQIAQHLLTLEEPFTTRTVSAALDMDPRKVSMSLKQLHRAGAIMATKRGSRRAGNDYTIADRRKLQLRVDGVIGAGRPRKEAAEAVAEPEHLTFAVDHDGDLQIIKPDGEVFMVDNENARRLVGFVCLSATQILMAGAQ